MGKKNKKKQKSKSGAEGVSSAQEAALKEAVEAARASAEVLREAASALSQAQAISLGLNAPAQLPTAEEGQPEVVPAQGVQVSDPVPTIGGPWDMPDVMDDGLQDMGSVSAAVSQSPMEEPLHQSAITQTAQDAVNANRPAKAVRASAGYKPKEPSEQKTSFLANLFNRARRGSRQSNMNASDDALLTNLPKFGDAPDPLPEPEEILQSIPSLTSVAFGQTAAQEVGIIPNMPYYDSYDSYNGQGYGSNPADQYSMYDQGFSVEYDSNGNAIYESVSQMPASQVAYGEIQTGDPTMQQGYEAYGYDGYDEYGNYYGDYAGYDNYDPYAYAAEVKGGKATVSLICGILSILLAFIPPIGIILAVVAILMAKLYMKAGGMAPRAGTGRVCGIVGLALSIILFIAIGVFLAYFVGGLYGNQNAGAIMGYLQTTPIADFI